MPSSDGSSQRNVVGSDFGVPGRIPPQQYRDAEESPATDSEIPLRDRPLPAAGATSFPSWASCLCRHTLSMDRPPNLPRTTWILAQSYLDRLTRTDRLTRADRLYRNETWCQGDDWDFWESCCERSAKGVRSSAKEG
jgi:hypothetical protein